MLMIAKPHCILVSFGKHMAVSLATLTELSICSNENLLPVEKNRRKILPLCELLKDSPQFRQKVLKKVA